MMKLFFQSKEFQKTNDNTILYPYLISYKKDEKTEWIISKPIIVYFEMKMTYELSFETIWIIL